MGIGISKTELDLNVKKNALIRILKVNSGFSQFLNSLVSSESIGLEEPLGNTGFGRLSLN